MLTSPPVPFSAASPLPEGAGADLADAAEEVRAWFVQVRGGAAFLSGADGRVLVDWLDGGVPVSRILRAIDATAARRRARRSRRPFALVDIRAALQHEATAETSPRRRTKPAPAARGADTAAEVARTLAAIRALTGDPEARARAGCELARRFHEAVWAGLAEGHAALLAAAAEELAGLAGQVDEEVFQALCEEVARDRVRARYPELSAARVWEECTRVVE